MRKSFKSGYGLCFKKKKLPLKLTKRAFCDHELGKNVIKLKISSFRGVFMRYTLLFCGDLSVEGAPCNEPFQQFDTREHC